MKKIALIGAPTAGKTELAHKLNQKLNYAVVDDYVKEASERSNIAFGHFATYIGNVQVAICRWENEQIDDTYHPKGMITCGTVVETCVYTAINAFIQRKASGGFDERQMTDKRAMTTMTWLGMFTLDTFDYDHVFYLPLSEEGQKDNWNRLVDAQIPDAAVNLGINYITLSENPLEEILKEIETPPSD